MNSKKKVLIPLDYYIDLLTYVAMHADPDDPRYIRIQEEDTKKQRAMMANELYTSYKTSKTFEGRYIAREHYLDHVGVPDEKRWLPKEDVNVTHEMPSSKVTKNK